MDLLTWNLEGKHTASGEDKWEKFVKEEIVDKAPDVACFQEFGKAPKEKEVKPVTSFPAHSAKLYEWTDSRVAGTHYLLHYKWAKRKVNPAILWRGALTPNPQGAVVFADSGFTNFRDAPGVVTANHGSVYSVHAASKNQGPNARRLLANVDGNGRPWIAAGDFNVEPGRLRGRLKKNGHGWTICPPDEPTREVKQLDYAVRDAGPAVTGTVYPVEPSDHEPVVFEGI